MSAKGVLRTVKNYTKGYSPMQMKVRSATSNEPGAPSIALMGEIAQATYNQTDFLGVMEIIDKRMNDKGRLWRHVFKALTVLDFLLHSGSPYVVEYAIDNLFVVKTLREFQHIDDSGRDQGANVRQKAKELTALLSDRSRLEAERKNRNWMQNRTGFNDPSMGHYNNQYASSSGRLPYGSGRSESRSRPGHTRGGSLSTGSQRYNEDDGDMRKAIVESKRSSASKNVPANYDEDAELKRALEESALEARAEEEKNKTALVKASEADLLGGFDDVPTTNSAMASTSNFNSMNSSMLSNNMMGGGNMFNNSSSVSFSQQQQQFSSSSAAGDLMNAFGGQMNSSNQFAAMSSMTATSNMSSANPMGDMSNPMGGMSGANTFTGMNTGRANNFDPFGLNSNNTNTTGMNSGMNSSLGFTGMGMSSAISPNVSAGMGMGMTAPMGVSSPMAGATPGAFDGNAFNSSSQFMSQSSMTASKTESASGMNPFGQTNPQQSANLFGNNSSNLLDTSTAGTSSAGGFGGASGAFGNAFDGGAGAKSLFGTGSDPNSRLAEIARNSDKIDPFASLAMSSSSGNPFGTASVGGSSQALMAPTSMSGMGSQASMAPTGMSSMNSQVLAAPTGMSGMNSMTSTPGNLSGNMTGGGSLLDFNASTQASSTSMTQQSFGQVNRNPFANDGGSVMMGTGNKQPSMNQLMSASSSQAANSSNMFAQQQTADGAGGFSNMQAQAQNASFQQHNQFQQQQPQMPQQQQQLNPFAQNTNQVDFFGL
ncbi:hypothetical protein LPJ63_003084 [Coemansia sp. RSA 2711]|nr:hypothetical protein LPJ63_003084 [Coemansia sp. RSA 2711]